MGLDAGHLRTFSEAVLNILEKYTIAIPSSTIHLPDISLFDHLKTTAAFAVVLYQAAVEKNVKDLASLKKPIIYFYWPVPICRVCRLFCMTSPPGKQPEI